MRCVYLPLLTVGTFSSKFIALYRTITLTCHLTLHKASGTTLVIWYVAESSATIIAASIPVLRALIKEISSSIDRYGRSTGKSGAKSQTAKGTPRGLHASHVVTVISRRDPHDPHGDASSDKSILDAGRAPGKIEPGRIMQTQEVRLSYHDRSDNDSDQGYEMDYMRKDSA